MRHLVGVVVQPYDGFPLLYARQYCHQSSVSHYQVQVVLGQVKVHRLTGNKKTQWHFSKYDIHRNNSSSAEKITMRATV